METLPPLGNLGQYSIVFSKKCSLMLRRNLLCFSLFLLPLILGAAGQTLASSMHPPFRYFYRSIIFPLSLVFSTLNSLSQLLLLGEMLQSLHIFIVHCWALSTMSTSKLQSGAQNWIWYSRCGSPTANRGSHHLPRSLPGDNAVKITGA